MSDFLSVLSFIADEIQLLIATLQMSLVGQLILFLLFIGLVVSSIITIRGGGS